jgi:hypothetical protein
MRAGLHILASQAAAKVREEEEGGGGAALSAIVLTADEVEEAATNGTLVGTLFASGGTAPYSYALTVNPGGRLAIVGNALNVAASFSGLTTSTFTVAVTDATAAAFAQEFTISVIASIDNDSGLDEGDGDIETPDEEDPEFDGDPYVEPPVQQSTSDGLKIAGKNGGTATFLKDMGAPVAGSTYTIRYTADWSQMSRLGREAAIGFAFKNGNDFHLAALRGDGAASTVMLKSKIHGDFRKANQFTVTGDGAASHGTKDGPNWLQLQIASNGSTYTLRTSSNGSTWTDAYTAAAPTPLSMATGATQFGPGGYFTNQDKGVFSVTIESFASIPLAPVNSVLPAITGTATEGQTLTASTGTWSGSPTFAYVWKRGGVAIGSATASTYLLVTADVGAVITVTVTATNAGGSADATSAGTSAVVAAVAARITQSYVEAIQQVDAAARVTQSYVEVIRSVG